jgi:hypothetical protein
VSGREGSAVLPSWWVLARDIGLFLLGVIVVVWELSRPEVRDAVLLFAGTLLGGPVAALGLSSVAEAIASRPRTDSSSPSSPADPQPPSAPS